MALGSPIWPRANAAATRTSFDPSFLRPVEQRRNFARGRGACRGCKPRRARLLGMPALEPRGGKGDLVNRHDRLLWQGGAATTAGEVLGRTRGGGL